MKPEEEGGGGLHQNGMTLGDVCRISYVNTQNKHGHGYVKARGGGEQNYLPNGVRKII